MRLNANTMLAKISTGLLYLNLMVGNLNYLGTEFKTSEGCSCMNFMTIKCYNENPMQ